MDALAEYSQFLIIAISFGVLLIVAIVASRMLRGARHRLAIVAVAVVAYLVAGNGFGALARRVFLPDIAAHSLADALVIILATMTVTAILTAVAILLLVRAVASKLDLEQERHS